MKSLPSPVAQRQLPSFLCVNEETLHFIGVDHIVQVEMYDGQMLLNLSNGGSLHTSDRTVQAQVIGLLKALSVRSTGPGGQE